MLLAVAGQDCLQLRAEGHQAALVELALPYGQQRAAQIDILALQTDCFTDT